MYIQQQRQGQRGEAPSLIFLLFSKQDEMRRTRWLHLASARVSYEKNGEEGKACQKCECVNMTCCTLLVSENT